MYTTLISTLNLAKNLQDPDWIVVDCRFALDDTEKGRNHYKTGHIPQAIYAHLDEDLSSPIIPNKTGRHPWPELDTIVQLFSQWGISDQTQVVAYDDSPGAIAARLWWILRWLGHTQVAVLDGGWKQWTTENHPVSQESPNPVLQTFNPRVQPQLIINVQDVLEFQDNANYCIADARSADRFRGENETIDPIAGHIPNAISAPFIENIDSNGTWHSPETLRNRFTALLKGTESSNFISYCGSGVTACHNLLALEHAGLEAGKLYPGSWSEWIIDPDRSILIG